MIFFQQLRATPILVDHGTGGIGHFISLSFHAYVDHPNQRLDAYVLQFEGKVVLDSELDSNSVILILIGLPPSRARLLGSPTPS